ncbi:hypothetical protein N7520_011096 [Penicillium odoratum]|uniref:uncharacterized protein n=1 Tax=Penicillium odoratum TaxID=1167516 RepID=UPI0025492413|nr:uncharacterized protein N7520_011096 [Penicillium odoratum]KAJ5745914.1 hypothetical protein N7520_011096 [Penicillium odoratum]
MESQHTGSALGALGANFNEKLTWMDHSELQRVNTHWIRGFIDMHQIDTLHATQDPNIQALFRAIDADYQTILTFKWNYTNLSFPAISSAAFTTELERLDRILHVVMGKVNILVIGNEPFIEVQPGQADTRLNIFYETLADTVINFRNTHGGSTRLYMGALNRLDLPAKQTPAVERMLRFIASKPELEGVDLHPHMPTLEGHKLMLEYVLSRIRPDQRFLATEFSLVWHWKKHLADVVSGAFCARYGFPAGIRVHEIISAAMQNPWPYAQWEDFLSQESWYIQRRSFLVNAMKLYRATGRLEVATYSFCPMRFRKLPLPVGGDPWMLNGVYAPSTVQLRPDGSRYENFPWAEEFRKVQKGVV